MSSVRAAFAAVLGLALSAALSAQAVVFSTSGSGGGGGGGTFAELKQSNAEVDVVNTTTETTLLSYTVPADLLGGTSRRLRVEMHGDQLNNSGSSDTWTLRIKYGATTMYADATTWATNAVRMSWNCNIAFGNATSTNNQYVSALFVTSTRGGATTGNGELDGSGLSYQVLSGSAAEDSTAEKVLVVTLQHSVANAATSFRMKLGRVYLE